MGQFSRIHMYSAANWKQVRKVSMTKEYSWWHRSFVSRGTMHLYSPPLGILEAVSCCSFLKLHYGGEWWPRLKCRKLTYTSELGRQPGENNRVAELLRRRHTPCPKFLWRERITFISLPGAGIAAGRAPGHHDQRAVPRDPARGPRGRRRLRVPGHQQRGHRRQRRGRAQRSMWGTLSTLTFAIYILLDGAATCVHTNWFRAS